MPANPAARIAVVAAPIGAAAAQARVAADLTIAVANIGGVASVACILGMLVLASA